jgi:RNA polymerase sigma-70 factor (ECF subfamily)
MVQDTGREVRETEAGAVSADWELFFRARDGDERAWHVLIGQHRTRLSALALLIVGSGAAADDVVQETFVRALRADVAHRRGTVGGFLGTIAYRLAVKEANRANRSDRLDGIDVPDPGQNPLDAILSGERDRLVAETIRSLDNPHRDALLLRFYGGHSYEEIADLTETPLGTVKSRIFYAVKTCRERLRQKGVIE